MFVLKWNQKKTRRTTPLDILKSKMISRQNSYYFFCNSYVTMSGACTTTDMIFALLYNYSKAQNLKIYNEINLLRKKLEKKAKQNEEK